MNKVTPSVCPLCGSDISGFVTYTTKHIQGIPHELEPRVIGAYVFFCTNRGCDWVMEVPYTDRMRERHATRMETFWEEYDT